LEKVPPFFYDFEASWRNDVRGMNRRGRLGVGRYQSKIGQWRMNDHPSPRFAWEVDGSGGRI
jgi:hypothetical protein